MKFNLSYKFKAIQEAAWFVFVSAAVFVCTELATTQDFGEWKTWLPILGAGVARTVAGALLAVFTKPGTVTPT